MNEKIFSLTDPDKMAIIDKDGTRGKPGDAINCFTGSTKISLNNGCLNLWRYFYSGELIIIEAGNGNILECTPNHPILTVNGWLTADQIQEGDYLVTSKSDSQGAIDRDVNSRETTFKELFDSLNLVRERKTIPCAVFNFHGDIPKTDVNAIRIDDLLPYWVKSIDEKQIENLVLATTDRIINHSVLGFDTKVFQSGFSGSFRQSDSFVNTQFAHSDFCCSTAISGNDPTTIEQFGNARPTDIISFRQSENAFPILIKGNDFIDIAFNGVNFCSDWNNVTAPVSQCLDKMVGTDGMPSTECRNGFPFIERLLRVKKKTVSIFSGHVYTLQSYNGWYSVTSANIISKNCKCTMRPIIKFDTGEEE